MFSFVLVIFRFKLSRWVGATSDKVFSSGSDSFSSLGTVRRLEFEKSLTLFFFQFFKQRFNVTSSSKSDSEDKSELVHRMSPLTESD